MNWSELIHLFLVTCKRYAVKTSPPQKTGHPSHFQISDVFKAVHLEMTTYFQLDAQELANRAAKGFPVVWRNHFSQAAAVREIT